MKTFKNSDFIKNEDCTNIVFCQSEKSPSDKWVECEESDIKEMNCNQLYIQAGVRYFGYL